jgi:hypothetical protein
MRTIHTYDKLVSRRKLQRNNGGGVVELVEEEIQITAEERA